jgi:hypothetical protein
MNVATARISFTEQLDAAYRKAESEDFISQGHCVDVLLDLMTATEEPTVRQLVMECLTVIRHANLVRADAIRGVLDLVSVVFEVEASFAHAHVADTTPASDTTGASGDSFGVTGQPC